MDTTNVETENKKIKKSIKHTLKNLTVKIIFLIITCYIIFYVIFGIKRMNTSYMNPKITEGDLLLYYRMEKKYELGDVILIKHENKEHVLRIIAKEGQTVNIDESGTLLIDGYPEGHEIFYKTEKNADSTISFPYTVEQGKYFVLNDYRVSKSDSRTFGTISTDEIKGRIMTRIQVRNI